MQKEFIVTRNMENPGSISVAKAARYIGVGSSTIIDWADAGVLPIAGRSPAGFRRFDRSVVIAFAAARVSQVGMSTSEVAYYLGVTSENVRNLEKAGLLRELSRTSGRNKHFDRKAVEKLAKTLVTGMSTSQVANYLGETAATIRVWAMSGKLREVGRTYGGHRRFDRKTVEAFAKARRAGKANT